MANICAVGLWTDISARLIKLPELTQLCVESLGGDIIPRSIIIEIFENIPYLVVSLGDGSVISYIIGVKHLTNNNEYELNERRKVVLGTQPTILKKFKSFKNEITNNIFACSDRPSVITTNNQKLVYSSVNLKQVEYMCQINSQAYPDSLALLSDGVLRIGTMDNIQKLHIRTVKLYETARRIAYQAETQTFGIITYRTDDSNTFNKPSASTLCPNQHICTTKINYISTSTNISGNSGASGGGSGVSSSTGTGGGNVTTSGSSSSGATAAAASSTIADEQIGNEMTSTNNNTNKTLNNDEECMSSSFLVLDQNTFEILHAVKFQQSEFAASIVSIIFEGDSSVYYVCGCCQLVEDEPEPKIGRLVIFKFQENKLLQIHEREIKGAPYTLHAFNGKLLASVSNTVKLFEFKDEQLNLLASFSDNVFITHMTCKNDFILVGDIMRSCSILIYRNDNNCFELVAKDNTPIWLSSIEMIDDENFIIGDSSFNLTTLKKDRY